MIQLLALTDRGLKTLELGAHYHRNADATGHSQACRTRAIPTIMGHHRTWDPENCERCVEELVRLEERRARRGGVSA